MAEAPGAAALGGAPGRAAELGVEVAGIRLAPGLAEGRESRTNVAIVTAGWATDWGEQRSAVRLLAGALALEADVCVISLDDRSNPLTAPPRRYFDGIFPIHSATAPPAEHRVAAIVGAAIERQPGASAEMGETAARGLLRLRGQPSSEALGILDHLRPDVVVLAGAETLWMGEALPVGPQRPRVVVLPLLGTDIALASPALRPFGQIADAVGAFSDAELGLLRESIGSAAEVQRLHLALPVNRAAASGGLAGTLSFGRYLLVLSGWPDDDPGTGVCPPHDYLREVLGDVSIAEVRHGGWLVSERGRRFHVAWAPSRMNLWRLMAHAAVTLDVRPPGPIGRETIESFTFATPVVVPAGSVAAEHAAAANGGLWYATPGEMLDQVGHLLDDDDLRLGLGRSGQDWAALHHGDTEAFVGEALRLVLGAEDR